MGTLIFAGLLYTNAVVLLGTCAFLLRAWTHRREDSEYWIASAMTICVAFYAYSAALHFHSMVDPTATPSSWSPVNGATIAGIFALATQVHFTLRYAQVRHEKHYLRVTYGLAAGYVSLVATGGWWNHDATRSVATSLFDVPIKTTIFEATPLAGSFYLLVGTVLLGTVLLMGRLYFGGRTESLAVFLGAVLLLFTVINDVAMAMGWHNSISLVPMGYSAYIFGITLTLVTRYAQRSLDLEQRTAELASRSRELEASYLELKETEKELVKSEQLAAVGRLAHVIAERVRTRIDIIKTTLTNLLDSDALSEQSPNSRLDVIDTETRRLADLVSRLLSYTRPTTPKVTPIDLKELLAPGIARADAIHGVQAELKCDGLWPEIKGDADLLRQLFDNLLDNALNALQGSGKLTVAVEDSPPGHEDLIRICITDNGPGMSPETKQLAMTPFFTTLDGHDGLGLAICQRVIEAHRGELRLAGQAGQGTTVHVSLPRDLTS